MCIKSLCCTPLTFISIIPQINWTKNILKGSHLYVDDKGKNYGENLK